MYRHSRLAYVAGVSVMREFSAFKVALITKLEPVYGIILAFIFFNDMKELRPGFWVGCAYYFVDYLPFSGSPKAELARRKSR